MNKIFFDLDGTLIDARRRLYDLFQRLVPQSCLTLDEYWNLKRSKINHQYILEKKFCCDKKDFELFEKNWLNLIETPYFLEKDVVIDKVFEVLDNLKHHYNLYLITARQNNEMTYWELEKLGLLAFFDDIFITKRKELKQDLILRKCQISNNDYFVGDTGFDILTGKSLGIKTIAVSYGFLARNILNDYEPDIIIDSFNEIVEKINEISS
jgi:phosphoglycolate phosphatase